MFMLRSHLKFRPFINTTMSAEFISLKLNFFFPSCCSRYASCLDYLENLKANLLLDVHLHDHVETLYDQIRHKALIQYTHPFVSVDLRMMASAFKTSVSGLEKELEALITDNQVQVYLDCYAPIFHIYFLFRSIKACKCPN